MPASVKSLEWVKPVINIKKLLEDVTDVHESQTSAVNLVNDDSLGDLDLADMTFTMPFVKMSDFKQQAFLKQIGITGKDIELV